MKAVMWRTAQGLVAFVCVLCLSFVLMQHAPGSPWASERALSPEALAKLESRYAMHLDVFLQRVLLHGDFGPSWKHPDQDVCDIVLQSLPVSLELGAWALLLSLAVGVPVGILTATRKDRWPDSLGMGVLLAGVVVPSFVVAPLLQEWIGLPMGQVAGWEGPASRVLPAICASLGTCAFVARLLRTSLIEALTEDHIRTARAKGLPESSIVLRHALPAALLPLIQYLAPASAALLTGTLVVEQVFQVPGMGRHFVQSALQRDYPLALGTLCVYCLLLLVLNALADLAVWMMDPRSRGTSR